MPQDDLQRRIDLLEQQMREHSHNGVLGGQVSLLDILDFIPTVSTAPTHTPRQLIDQFRIYTNGATLRFYWYDTTGQAWHYVTATA